MNLKTKGELNVTVCYYLLVAMKKWQLLTNNALSLDLIHGQFFPMFFCGRWRQHGQVSEPNMKSCESEE